LEALVEEKKAEGKRQMVEYRTRVKAGLGCFFGLGAEKRLYYDFLPEGGNPSTFNCFMRLIQISEIIEGESASQRANRAKDRLKSVTHYYRSLRPVMPFHRCEFHDYTSDNMFLEGMYV
jgi:hypothetical protein